MNSLPPEILQHYKTESQLFYYVYHYTGERSGPTWRQHALVTVYCQRCHFGYFSWDPNCDYPFCNICYSKDYMIGHPIQPDEAHRLLGKISYTIPNNIRPIVEQYLTMRVGYCIPEFCEKMNKRCIKTDSDGGTIKRKK